MRIEVSIDPPVEAVTAEALQAGRRGVTAAIGATGDALKAGWRAQIVSAGLGQRLANTIRERLYPGRPSLGAASLVWTKAPDIVDAHDRGALIRSGNGFWLAIPLPAAGSLPGNARMTPLAFERRTGLRLRFVYRRGRPSLLVAEGRVSAAGRAVRSRSKTGRGAATVPVFVLLPQVKLAKRLDVERLARAAGERLPALIAANWRDR
ncbi:MAG: DUF6441 family protein [Tabrizicola sp.]